MERASITPRAATREEVASVRKRISDVGVHKRMSACFAMGDFK